MDSTFHAFVVTEDAGKVIATLRDATLDELSEGNVLVRVAYSALNYKDGLALTGRNRVVRTYPLAPGIDYAGTVVESADPALKPGDAVVLTGWGVGERYWGGFSQFARAHGEWLVPVPSPLTLRQAMQLGTAGVTALMAIEALEAHGLTAGAGDVLVTGATGGVGSVAVMLLHALGHRVVAATRDRDAVSYLTALGAAEVVDSATLVPQGGPLGSARWAGAVDTVGGGLLAGVIRTLGPGGSVAACGNAGGFDVPTSVLPFILRGVNVLGIDSLPVPLARRKALWARLALITPFARLDTITTTIGLDGLPRAAEEILAARTRGRVLVDVNA
ncbi:MAG TPA: acryloyl-CoA reductase [Ktedonobacterales bacterium]